MLLLVVGALPAVFAAPHIFAPKHIGVACDDPMLGPLLRDRLLKSSPLGRHKVDLVTDTTPQERRQLAGMVRESRIDGFLWVDRDAISTGHVAYETRAQPDFLEKEF